MNIPAIEAALNGLAMFTAVKDSPLMRAFVELLSSVDGKNGEKDCARGVCAWAEFVREFVDNGQPSWAKSVYRFARLDDNAFTRFVERFGRSARLLETVAEMDFSRLSEIAAFDVCALGFYIAESARGETPQAAARIETEARALWNVEGTFGSGAPVQNPFAVPEAFAAFERDVYAGGAGVLTFSTTFRWEGRLVPALSPDPVRLSDLFGYEDQRRAVIANTKRFLEGKPANNILLYGDRGAGKSTTVKAVCNEYVDKGLRLVELGKDNLNRLPVLMKELSCRGPRFVIFIDDLSFETVDDTFTCFKSLLDGGVEKRPENTVVYAATNRRHFIRERFSDGPRAFDAEQEQLSLSDRFGLTIVFTAPDQELFIHIAVAIAQQRGVVFDETGRRKFRENALLWEKWFNGRSPRAAVQYVDWVMGGGDFPWE
ncbi:MAG: ATP-binding protein [Treponema sp.]|jgi:predicted AAA+ superfamily ATPase|nr:ATP-binding protein [Treponema sp.]